MYVQHIRYHEVAAKLLHFIGLAAEIKLYITYPRQFHLLVVRAIWTSVENNIGKIKEKNSRNEIVAWEEGVDRSCK